MVTTVLPDPALPMRELLRTYPGARRALFRRYHVGGCSSCGFSLDETLAQLCARNEQMRDVPAVCDYLLTSQEEDRRMQISPAELRQALQTGAPAPLKLLDIRTREEFEAVHLDGAELFSQELMQRVLLGWPRQEGLVVLIDHLGERSLDAAAYFAGQGFQNVRALLGGIDAWSQHVDPSLPRYRLET